MKPIGQILPGTAFGNLLTELTRQCEQIVEIGCWRGGGSTLCLVNGLVRPTQRIISIDADLAMTKECAARYKEESRIAVYRGTICTPELVVKPVYETGRVDLATYESDRGNVVKRPNVLHRLPNQIDLLLLDGGDFSSAGDFEILHPRSRFIALDDTVVLKNKRNRERCLEVGWRVLADRSDERNGWFICERVP